MNDQTKRAILIKASERFKGLCHDARKTDIPAKEKLPTLFKDFLAESGLSIQDQTLETITAPFVETFENAFQSNPLTSYSLDILRNNFLPENGVKPLDLSTGI